MLTEQVVLGAYRSPNGDSQQPSATDTPSVAVYDIHTGTLTASFKRSNTAHNGLAVTPTHLFAAQSDKAVINVYSRHKQALETTVPFPEKFTIVQASRDGEFLACGTESGRLLLWELASARFVSTPQTHLQSVTAIAFDSATNFVISGSADSNIYVWSLSSLLDVRDPHRVPERILDRHQREITAIITGRASGGGPSDIAITASKDSSCILWDYHTGTHLRTYIFPLFPLSLALDPVDRAFYTGFADGSVQSIDFYNAQKEGSSVNRLYADEYRDIPITVTETRWSAPSHDSPVLSMGVVYDGSYLVTGNEKGDVNVWDIATGHLFRNLAQMKAPITSLTIMRPTGFSFHQPTGTQTSLLAIPKPRFDAIVAATSSQTFDPSNYTLSTQLLGSLPETHINPLSVSFEKAPISTFTPASDMDEIARGAVEMASYSSAITSKHRAEAREMELTTLYEHCDHLSKLLKKTWDNHARWALEVAEEQDRTDSNKKL